MIGKDQGIRNHDVLSPSSIEDHNLGNVIGRERLTSFVYSVCLRFVTVESNNREFLLFVSLSLHLHLKLPAILFRLALAQFP